MRQPAHLICLPIMHVCSAQLSRLYVSEQRRSNGPVISSMCLSPGNSILNLYFESIEGVASLKAAIADQVTLM